MTYRVMGSEDKRLLEILGRKDSFEEVLRGE